MLSCLLKYGMQNIRNKRVLESGCCVGHYLPCFSETLLELTLRFLTRRSASPSISSLDNFSSSLLGHAHENGLPLIPYIDAIES